MLNSKRSSTSGACVKHCFGLVVLLVVLLAINSLATSHVSEESSDDAEVVFSDGARLPTTSAQTLSKVVYKPNLRVWLHPDGVRPAIIRAAPGRVVLRVNNETTTDTVLVLEQVQSGQTLFPLVRIPTSGLERRSFRSELVLEPAEYVYYSESRPQFKGRLIVALPE